MKITVLGAAGLRSPLLVQALLERRERLGVSELALMDTDPIHLEQMGRLTAVHETRAQGLRIVRTTNRLEALKDADYVITTFRVGGMEGRVIDERVPLAHGLLGQETTGAGGFALAMRTLPVLKEVIEEMRRVCRHAWLVNFANPAGLLAEAAQHELDWPRSVGICDAPASMRLVVAAFLQAQPAEVDLDYFGLNHLGWMRGVYFGGQNVLPNLLALLRQSGGISELPFPVDLMTSLGMIPNEYLFYYYFSRQAVENIKSGGQTRGEALLALNTRFFSRLEELKNDQAGMLAAYRQYLAERGEGYMRGETGHKPAQSDAFEDALKQVLAGGGYAGVALDLIETLNGGPERKMIVNVANRGSIEGMAEDDTVEIPVVVGRDRISPQPVGKLPQASLGLMSLVKAYERLTIRAALHGSYAAALEALTIHPLVADVTLAERLIKEFSARHAPTFPHLV